MKKRICSRPRASRSKLYSTPVENLIRLAACAAALLGLLRPHVVWAQSTGSGYDPLSNTISTPHPINPAANTTNPSALAAQGQNPFLGSVQQCDANGMVAALSLEAAITCGLRFNLGLIDTQSGSAAARAAQMRTMSVLLPQIYAEAREEYAQYSAVPTGAEKLRIPVPGMPAGIAFPLEAGPFNYQDSSIGLTQTIFDETSRHLFLSASRENRASIAAVRDSRDIVVLAVGSAYLQVVASKARLEASEAELKSAVRFDEFTQARVKERVSPAIDGIRSEVARHTAEQRVTDAAAGLEKDKLTLARVVGLPLNKSYDITDDVPYDLFPAPDPAAAVQRALQNRSDLKSAEESWIAAQENVRAQSDQRLPTLSVGASYGGVGTNPGNIQQTYAVGATFRIPIFTGRRIESDIATADAELLQRKAAYEDLKGRVEYDVRTALLDLYTAEKSVHVAERNRNLAQRGLSDTQDRYRVGISTSLEVVQAEQAVEDADDNYINSLFGYNIAKLDLARSMGLAATDLSAFLKGK